MARLREKLAIEAFSHRLEQGNGDSVIQIQIGFDFGDSGKEAIMLFKNMPELR